MIRAGFIGVGGISRSHLAFLATRADVRIEALCDPSPENLSRRRAEFGGAGFESFEAMLDAVPLDAVWICTPPQVREGPLLACARKGIPVFCEKPVERSEESGRAIAGALAKLNARVQVGYLFRSLPVISRLRQEMQGDQVHLVQSFYGCGVSLNRSLPQWFYDKALSGGALGDQATHDLDLLRCLFGEVTEVVGLARNPVGKKGAGYTVDEVLSVSFAFRNGIVGSHVHTWIGDDWRNEMHLSGERRYYHLDLTRGTLVVNEGPDTRSFAQGSTSLYSYENEIFLRQVESGDWSGNPCDFADGLKTLELTHACDRSFTSGRVTLG
jgi:predicted dehydrogenase